MDVLIGILYIMPFLLFAYTDYHYQVIFNRDLLVTGFLFLFIKIHYHNASLILMQFAITLLWYFLLLLLVLMCENILDKYLLGGGDLKLIALIIWGFSIKIAIVTILIGFTSAIIYLFINKLMQKKGICYIPLAPFLTIGLIISLYIRYVVLSNIYCNI